MSDNLENEVRAVIAQIAGIWCSMPAQNQVSQRPSLTCARATARSSRAGMRVWAPIGSKIVHLATN